MIGPGHAESLLSSIIDGMDMAKFKTPRCKAAFSSKEFDGAWRPPLHVSGMLIDGVVELIYLGDADIKKGGQPSSSNAFSRVPPSPHGFKHKVVSDLANHVCLQACLELSEAISVCLFACCKCVR